MTMTTTPTDPAPIRPEFRPPGSEAPALLGRLQGSGLRPRHVEMASTSLALLAFGGLAAETKDGAAAAAGTLSFAGADPSAALFAHEVASSFAGVLQYNYFASATTIHTGGSGWLGLAPCAEGSAEPSQLWPWPPSNSSAPLTAAGGECVDCRSDATHNCSDGDDVQLYQCLGTANQRWHARPCPGAGGAFLLVSEKSGRCLGVAGKLEMTSCSCSEHAWHAVAGKSTGTAQLRTAHEPALCLAGNASGGTTFPAGYVREYSNGLPRHLLRRA